jgi:hypothetical protein
VTSVVDEFGIRALQRIPGVELPLSPKRIII